MRKRLLQKLSMGIALVMSVSQLSGMMAFAATDDEMHDQIEIESFDDQDDLVDDLDEDEGYSEVFNDFESDEEFQDIFENEFEEERDEIFREEEVANSEENEEPLEAEESIFEDVLPVTGSGYNRQAAVNYAAAHWDDDPEYDADCANFVSQCIQAGGCDCYSAGGSTLRRQLLASGMGTGYDLEFINDGYRGSVLGSNYPGIIEPGDVLMFYCSYCDEYDKGAWAHTVLVAGLTSDGWVRAYSHTGANSGSSRYYYPVECWDCHNDTICAAWVYHFDAGNSPSSGISPVGYHEITEGGKGTIRVAGWALDDDEPNTSLTMQICIGGKAGESGVETYTCKADIYRQDVLDAFGEGAYHGFDTTIKTNKRGTVPVYVYALDVGSNSADNALIETSPHTTTVSNIPCVIDFPYDSVEIMEGETKTIEFKFWGDGIQKVNGLLADGNTIGGEYLYAPDFSLSQIPMAFKLTGKKAGNTSWSCILLNENGSAICSRVMDVTVIASKTNVSGVTLNKSETSIAVGNTEQLTATVKPSNATDKTVTWKSSNTSIATVDSKGIVTAKAAGTVKITATATNGTSATTDDVAVTCTITVTSNKINVRSMSIDSEITLYENSGRSILPMIDPYNATDQTIIWKSSNPNVATVDAHGNISAVSAGTTTITATATNGTAYTSDDITETCLVTVKKEEVKTVPVSDLVLNKTSLELKVGETTKLYATIKPSNATNQKIAWVSSSYPVVSVDDYGNVTAVSAGKATITALVMKDDINWEKYADCDVVVIANEPTETPTSSPTEDPTVTPTETPVAPTVGPEPTNEPLPIDEPTPRPSEEDTSTPYLVKDGNGIFNCYVNGERDYTYKGYVNYEGSKFYVENGSILLSLNGVMIDPNSAPNYVWYFCSNGQVQTQHVGLALYDGEWFYIENGKVAVNMNAFVKYDGGLFAVAAGRIVREYSGLMQDPQNQQTGDWYYFAEGQAQTQYTGLAQYDGQWFYIRSGKLATDITGAVMYDGASFWVEKGMVK